MKQTNEVEANIARILLGVREQDFLELNNNYYGLVHNKDKIEKKSKERRVLIEAGKQQNERLTKEIKAMKEELYAMKRVKEKQQAHFNQVKSR